MSQKPAPAAGNGRAQPVARIVSTGRFLPERVLTNAELEKMVDTSDAWIRERTGISERRICDEGTDATVMGTNAARQALAKAGLTARDVDMLIVTTATPDRFLPTTSCEIHAAIDAPRSCFAYDLQAACTGFLYALSMAEGAIAAGRAETVLVVSTEKMSSIIDWDDRATCILFGDGAGAAVVQPSTDGSGILASHHCSDGNLAELITRQGGGARRPLTVETLRRREHLLHMEGPAVFKSAVRAMSTASARALRAAGLTADDIDLLVPHQANARIIESTAKYARVPMERVFVNLHRYGNISSATIPVGLDEAVEEGRIESGSHVLLAAFGAGLTWGAMAVRW